jgi:propionate CoA-transferase
MDKLMSAEKAVGLIKNGDTINIVASGGGFQDADMVYAALEKRFLETGEPKDCTFVHITGVGGRNFLHGEGRESGMGYFAHKGLVKRIVGGHWRWSRVMGKLALAEEIEAYNLPQGVLSLLMREIAAHRVGLITPVGLRTCVDPRVEGGKLNKRAQSEDLVELINIHGREMLLYKAFPINVCIVRGTTADEDGNISVELEALDLHMLPAAQATYNSGGIVIAQVKRIAKRGTLNPRMVRVPAHMVTAVVHDPKQWQTYNEEYDPGLCGHIKVPVSAIAPLEFGLRKLVARRAAMELKADAVVNLGIGIADGIGNVASEEGVIDDFIFSIEMGIVGGVPTKGVQFGGAWNPECIMSMPSQFDFYHGGGLDFGCLGMGQMDEEGNVNVSKLGTDITGTGGFIDISQNAKNVVFCAPFMNGKPQIEMKDGKLNIIKDGAGRKFLKKVDQITFSGKYATETKQNVLYVTERAVFKLENGKVVLKEIAPGIDLQKDVLAQMDFAPVIADDLKTMDAAIFKPEKMLKNNPDIFPGFPKKHKKH